jgi:uncharacterized protein
MPWLAPLIVLAGAGALLWLGRRFRDVGAGGRNPYAARAWRYQPAALAVAIIAVLLVRLAVPDHADYLQVGDWSAPASGLGWLGVADGDAWSTVGLTFLVVMTVVTAVVVWFQAGRGAGLTVSALARALPLAVVFSAANALTEELLFRVTLAEALGPVTSATVVALVAAAVFGIPHWFGSPGRVPGVILAGFMGWFLTLSVLQTGGIGWAWTIHVVQDIVIITVLMARERCAAPTRHVLVRS